MAEPSSPSLVGDAMHPAPPILSSATVLPPEAGPGLHGSQRRGAGRKVVVCPTCCSTNARNLVVCIDGTSNRFGYKVPRLVLQWPGPAVDTGFQTTNVVELYASLIKDNSQLTFYSSGVGTYAKPSWKTWSYYKQVLVSKLDLAFALRLENIIISAYAWLVDNYEIGDRIFLFGFSRGAYQVRALAAMIDVVGLLPKGNIGQIAFAYEIYAATGKETHGSRDRDGSRGVPIGTYGADESIETHDAAWRSIYWRLRWEASCIRDGVMRATMALGSRILRSREREDRLPSFPIPRRVNPVDQGRGYWSMQSEFKRTLSRHVVVHFVGAWDTVSSVGLVRGRTLPGTTDGMKFVCFFRHALALHEYRVKFLPEYANGGDGPDPEMPRAGSSQPHTKEVWFSGSHSDVGGSTSDRVGPALRWMMWEAKAAGMRLADFPYRYGDTGVSSSMTLLWRIIECLPIKHLSYEDHRTKDDINANHRSLRNESITRKPHFSANRRIKPGQHIHQSVYTECGEFALPIQVEMEQDEYLESMHILPGRQEILACGYVLDEQRTRRLKCKAET